MIYYFAVLYIAAVCYYEETLYSINLKPSLWGGILSVAVNIGTTRPPFLRCQRRRREDVPKINLLSSLSTTLSGWVVRIYGVNSRLPDLLQNVALNNGKAKSSRTEQKKQAKENPRIWELIVLLRIPACLDHCAGAFRQLSVTKLS